MDYKEDFERYADQERALENCCGVCERCEGRPDCADCEADCAKCEWNDICRYCREERE